MSQVIDESIAPVEPTPEGRLLTFLIADVRGYTRFTVEYGDEAAARLTERFAYVAREAARAHAGEVVELRGDEVLATFTSSRQAILAALDLQSRIADAAGADPSLAMTVGIGLDAGEAIPVEGGYRGSALNLAARLCSLAGPGEVLASDTITTLARRVPGAAYRERGLVELNGFADSIRVLEVVSEEAQPIEISGLAPEDGSRELPIGGYLGSLPSNPLVGRETELMRVTANVDSVLRGAGELVLLAGEPGAGKTRLAQEITLILRNRGFLTAAGRCYEAQQAVPYYPFVDAFNRLFVLAPPSLRREVPGRWPDLAYVLPGRGLPAVDVAIPQDQQRLFWAVTGFLQALSAWRPVALLLDDLHWADAASLELLQHLARHTDVNRVLLLGTYRDVEVNRQHPLEGALRDLQREELVDRIEVRRLSREETAGLIGSVMGEQAISPEFADLVYRRTEGNAFFVQQVMRALVERGDLFRTADGWDRKGIEEIEVPESVRSVVGQRLARLPEEAQETLREASVLGQTFTFEDLQAMTGRAEGEMEGALEAAMQAGMVREGERDSYAFDHALTQGALYAELSSRRKRRLHLAAGEALESVPERRRAGREAELAWHFLEADDPERALHWSLAAGDAATAIFGHSEAEYHYRNGFQLAVETGDLPHELEAREKLGSVLRLLSRNEEALEVVEPAVRAYRAADDLDDEMRCLAEVGWLLFELNRRDEGIERLQPVLERWEETKPVSAGAASLHIALATLYWHGGRLPEALSLAERAISLAASAGDDHLLGLAEVRRALLLSPQPSRQAEALESFGRGIPLLEKAGDLVMLASALNNRAIFLGDRAEFQAAWADFEQALEVARRVGTPTAIGWHLGILAMLSWAVSGDRETARSLFEEMKPLERYIRGTRGAQFIASRVWFRLAAEGDESALDDLRRLAAEGEEQGDISLWQGAVGYLAQLELAAGDGESARERCLVVLAQAEMEQQYRVQLQQMLVRAYVACGEIERAQELMTALEVELEGSSWSFHVLAANVLRGEVLAAQHRWEEARSTLEKAVEELRARGLLISLGAALDSLGSLLAEMGETEAAREALTEALEIFRRLPVGPLAEQTERRLDALLSIR